MDTMPIIIMISILIVIAAVLVISDYLLSGKKDKKIVLNRDEILPVTGEGTILNFLTDNKIFIPSACGGKATCGHCKVKVLSGAGDILPTEEVYLSQKEKSDGTRLACQVKVRDDIELYLPEELLEAQEYESVVEEITDLTDLIKFVKVKLITPEKISFKPGQYVQIKVPGEEVFRAYSISSPPWQDDSIEFIIRQVHKGLCSTYIHKVLEIGEKLYFTGPYGEFFLNEDSDKDIICIACSCGMAPVRSILLHLKERNMPRKVTYFFGARYKKDLFYVEELLDLQRQYPNFRYVPALTKPKPEDNWSGETGRITTVIERLIGSAADFEAYLCGPPPMIDDAIKILIRKGIDEHSVFYDKF